MAVPPLVDVESVLFPWKRWRCAMTSAALPRRLLARRLLELRERAKLTRDKAAKVAEISSQTLWRLENGQVAQ